MFNDLLGNLYHNLLTVQRHNFIVVGSQAVLTRMKKFLIGLVVLAGTALPANASLEREALASEFFGRQFCLSWRAGRTIDQATEEAARLTIARYGTGMDLSYVSYYGAIFQYEYCPQAFR